MTCAKYVTITLVKPGKLAAVTGSTTPKRHGRITLWQGDPRVNIQDEKGMAKAYQVKQVLKAIERLEAQENVEE